MLFNEKVRFSECLRADFRNIYYVENNGTSQHKVGKVPTGSGYDSGFYRRTDNLGEKLMTSGLVSLTITSDKDGCPRKPYNINYKHYLISLAQQDTGNNDFLGHRPGTLGDLLWVIYVLSSVCNSHISTLKKVLFR